MEWYMRREQHTSSRGELDPIPPEIVGTVDTRRLRSCACNAAWATEVVGLLVGRLRPEESGLTAPSVGVYCPEAIRPLVECGLLEPHKGRVRAACGLFTIAKKNGKMRVIFDARPANALTKRHHTPFSLFSLDELLGAWQVTGGEVTVVDYRHFFYQLPLPTCWRDYFVIREGSRRWRPTAVTMGWQDAPVLAQTVTWLIAMHREPQEKDLGLRLVHDGNILPKYAQIVDSLAVLVGYLFVLLDGIAVMSASQEVHTLWTRRILRNSAIFRVAVKEVTRNTFCGVEFDDRQGAKLWKPEASLGPWTSPTTRRDVAKRLGMLLWQMRVLQVELLDEGPIMRLYSRIGSDQRVWDEPHGLGELEVEMLRTTWERYAIPRWVTGGRKNRASRWVWAITDATPTSRAVLIVSRDGLVVKQQVSGNLPVASQIVREMEAIVEAGKLAGKEVGCLVATDADSCRLSIERRYSRSPVLRECLRTLFLSCMEVAVLRVSSEENPADEPSRGLAVDSHKVLKVAAVMREWDEARQRQSGMAAN